jgi:hypothetical protein
MTSVGLLGAFLAPLALATSLSAAVLVYQSAFPAMDASEQGTASAEGTSSAQEASTEQAPAYLGVQDPWVLTGNFTIGDPELDVKIKEFCDAFSGEGTSSDIAAQTVYNNIVWGNYTPREDGQQPRGKDWSWVAARLYFDAAKPEEGEAGDGDYYEYAAALTCCLHYFGYTYATALPIVTYDEWGNQSGSAICYVVDESGARYVCDPSQGTLGWMIDAATQDILVDDIGQDLSDAEMLGLPIARHDAEQAVEVTDETAQYDDGTGTGEEYSEYDEYGNYVGYDEYGNYVGYDEYGYDEGATM